VTEVVIDNLCVMQVFEEFDESEGDELPVGCYMSCKVRDGGRHVLRSVERQEAEEIRSPLEGGFRSTCSTDTRSRGQGGDSIIGRLENQGNHRSQVGLTHLYVEFLPLTICSN
jgi:hypothetical protein